MALTPEQWGQVKVRCEAVYVFLDKCRLFEEFTTRAYHDCNPDTFNPFVEPLPWSELQTILLDNYDACKAAVQTSYQELL